MNRYWLILCLLSSAISYIDAQSLKSEEVDIVKPYQPTLAEALKIKYLPDLPKFTVNKPSFEYQIPPKLLNLKYHSPNLSPVAVGTEKYNDLTKMAISLGGGNRNTSYANINYHNQFSAKSKSAYGITFNNISSNSNKLANQRFNKRDINAYTVHNLKLGDFSTYLGLNSHDVYFYGYDHTVETYSKNQASQNFLNFTSGLKFDKKKFNDLDYKASLDFNYLINKFNATDMNINFKSWMTKLLFNTDSIDQHKLNVDFGVKTNNYKDSIQTNRFMVKINPKYVYDSKDWYLSAGVDFTTTNGKAYIFPDFVAERTLIKKKLIFHNGWRGYLDFNTLTSMSNLNPFLASNVSLQNTRYENIYSGFKGLITTQFGYNVNFSRTIIRNAPLLVNDTNDMRKFIIIYDPVLTVNNLHLEFTYKRFDKLQLMLTADYFDYTLKKEAKAWHKPSGKINFSTIYNLGNKINIRAEIYFVDRIPVKLANAQTLYIKGTTDINLHINYSYSSNISIFLNLNNLASVKWERWYHYKTYGFNGLFGLKLKF